MFDTVNSNIASKPVLIKKTDGDLTIKTDAVTKYILTRDILVFIANSTYPVHCTDIAKHVTDLSVDAIRRHLKRLHAAGLIVLAQRGKSKTHYYLASQETAEYYRRK